MSDSRELDLKIQEIEASIQRLAKACKKHQAEIKKSVDLFRDSCISIGLAKPALDTEIESIRRQLGLGGKHEHN